MRKIRTYREVVHDTGSEVLEQVLGQRERLASRLSRVGSVVAVVSGKGGVGKSAVTANLAVALAGGGLRVGVVDADLNGPSMARMLGAPDGALGDTPDGVEPAEGVAGVRLISMELLQDEDAAPLRWRGPDGDSFVWQSTVETGVLREFLSDVLWGELDFLLVDVPPGTDKMARLMELVPDLDQALLVTTPGEMSRLVVARSARMILGSSVGSVGLVANMTHFVCPDCEGRHSLFPGSGDQTLAASWDLDVWARIPFDPAGGARTDRGEPPTVDPEPSPLGDAFRELAARVREAVGRGEAGSAESDGEPHTGPTGGEA